MNNRTELINFISNKINAKCYVEIGVYNPDHNFNKILVDKKLGVDPDPNAGAKLIMTSDQFFQSAGIFELKVDLIFIDGLHHAGQVKKDILNAWNILNHGGAIVLHDSNPPTVKTTCVPRGKQREWCGDVYKTICQIISSKFTVDFDYGCCVLHKNGEELKFTDQEFEWEEFDIFRKELLNLVPVEEAIKIIDSWT